MRLHSSSTLSSKAKSSTTPSKPSRSPLQTVIITGLWTLCFLGLFDVAINRIFPYPTDPLAPRPSQLKTYFEYGRSIEGKLARMIGTDDRSSAVLAKAGWLDPQTWSPATLPPNKNLLIAVYGMSFSEQIAEAMEKLDPRLAFRRINAPSAPPNHSYTAYKLDRGRHSADVVMLGILASSIKAMPTLSAATWQFEVPSMYTYPRYELENGTLQAIEPKVHSLAEFRNVLHDPQSEFVKQLESRDRAYSSFLFQRNWLDQSAIVRLVRRAWAQRHIDNLDNSLHTAEGFADTEMSILQAMVSDFAATARQDGKFPIVLVFNDKGYEDHLIQALLPRLGTEAIPYVSTHAIAPASNLSNFVGDGHFIPPVNDRIAKAVLTVINQSVPRKKISK
ncbi:hypothetical protein [Myxacorys almedinensis]|uniref:Uncharacterized protein n=1 Tax=Myxacorys almedinensis A TaxID=2690445 RepID=A0A8J8CIE6_9CYAN|nr:hypothetical protein [Myxacorys almedinensis]NDJ17673.1 hypothetical protein [Myxacorys almedinensis A]